MILDKPAEQLSREDIDPVRVIYLERADARLRALEEAANVIRSLEGNPLYQKAWKAAVIAIRSVMARP